jgi:hypothetical protein
MPSWFFGDPAENITHPHEVTDEKSSRLISGGLFVGSFLYFYAVPNYVACIISLIVAISLFSISFMLRGL